MGAPNGVPVFFLISARGVFGDPALAVPIVERVGRHCRLLGHNDHQRDQSSGGSQESGGVRLATPKAAWLAEQRRVDSLPYGRKGRKPFSFFKRSGARSLFSGEAGGNQRTWRS
jgi:hypothetical protein